MNSLSAKPFESKTFFLDLSTYSNSAKLSKDLVQMGAKEVFSIPSASFVVSDRPCIKPDCNSPTPFSGPRSNSPLFRDSTLDFVNSPVAHSPSFEQKTFGERVKPMSRGLSMLMKANEKTQRISQKKDTIVDLCKRWNIKIYPLQKVLKFIEKYKMKHHKVLSSKGNSESINLLLEFNFCKKETDHYENLKKYESEDVSKIPPPFIKIEDVNREFRPKYKTLTSPKIVDSFLFKCVKNLVKNTKQSSDVKEFARPVLLEMSVMSQISRNEMWRTEPVSVTKPPGFNSVSNSMSICAPSTVFKEGRKNQTHAKTKKEKKKTKKEYCEICRIHYTNGESHFEKESHQKFLDNSENFAVLTELISTLPNVHDFIAKLQKEEETIMDICENEIQSNEDSISTSCLSKDNGNSVPNIACGDVTERYSVNEDEIISSSRSCPSTPLPYLQEREHDDVVSFSHSKRLRNEMNTLTNQIILNQDSRQTSCNSQVTGSNMHENNCFYVTETSCYNHIYHNKMDDISDLPLNLSCDDKPKIMCPAQRIISDVLSFGEKQLECPSRSLLTNGESLCLSTNYYVTSVTPLDLSHIPENMNAQDVSENSINIVDNTTLCNISPSVDFTEKCSRDNLQCGTNVISTTAIDNPEEEPSLTHTVCVEDQVNNSNCKIDNNDSETDIYSSQSESDTEILSKIVESCIEEVDKDLEKHPPDVPEDSNEKQESLCFNMVDVNAFDDSLNVNLDKVLPFDDVFSVKETESCTMDFSNSNIRRETLNANDFDKHASVDVYPLSTKIPSQSDNSSIPKVVVSESFKESNMCAKDFASSMSVECINYEYHLEKNITNCKSMQFNNSYEHSENYDNPPAKRMRLHLQHSCMSDEINYESVMKSGVDDRQFFAPFSVEATSKTTCLHDTHSVVNKKHLDLLSPDDSNLSHEFKTPVKSIEIQDISELPSSKSQSASAQLETEVLKCSKNIYENELNSVVTSVVPENSFIYKHSTDSFSDIKLSTPEKINNLNKNALDTNNIYGYSDVADFSKPPALEPIGNNPIESQISDIDDSSMPPILEPVNNIQYEVSEDSGRLHSLLQDFDKSIGLKSNENSIEFLSNMNNQFHFENQLMSSSVFHKDVKSQCFDANNEVMSQSFQDELCFTSDEKNSNNCLPYMSENSTCKRICNDVCQIQDMSSDFIDDTEKLKRISKVMDACNISFEEFDCHDVFIVLDDASCDSETEVDASESDNFQFAENIESKYLLEQLNQIGSRNTKNGMQQSLNLDKISENVSCIVHDAYGEIDVDQDSKDKFNVKDNELTHIDKIIDEEVKTCLNALTYNVELMATKSVVIDNATNIQMNISTANYKDDFHENLMVEVTEETIKHDYDDVNFSVDDFINDMQVTNVRKITSDNDIEGVVEEQNRKFLKNDLPFEGEKTFLDNHNISERLDDIKYQSICDKEVKIIIPKLTVADLKETVCEKEIKIIIPKLDSIYSNICERHKINHADLSQFQVEKDNFQIDSSSEQSADTDVPTVKNSHITDGTEQGNPNCTDKSNELETNTSGSCEMFSHYNINKIGDTSETLLLKKQYVRCVSDTSEEINSSVNESLNTSSDIDSKCSYESTDCAYDFYSVQHKHPNTDTSDNVQNKAVHIVYLNSPQPLTDSCI